MPCCFRSFCHECIRQNLMVCAALRSGSPGPDEIGFGVFLRFRCRRTTVALALCAESAVSIRSASSQTRRCKRARTVSCANRAPTSNRRLGRRRLPARCESCCCWTLCLLGPTVFRLVMTVGPLHCRPTEFPAPQSARRARGHASHRGHHSSGRYRRGFRDVSPEDNRRISEYRPQPKTGVPEPRNGHEGNALDSGDVSRAQ